MTKEELEVLAQKIKEGKATPEEVLAFFSGLKDKVEELNKFLASLSDKKI